MQQIQGQQNEKTTYQVVARRYRPTGFDQLIGQDHVRKALENAITTGRIGHAYLFTGARGVGKTSSARILAKALNCIHGPTVTPCNECEICQSIGLGEDIDVLEIDGASNRGIDDIRELRKNASIRPSRARYKIYIIDEVHALTQDAFNALLKTLEEPPEHVKFIFCTTEPNKIPITILSRCQRFDFAGIDASAIASRLNQIISQEGANAEPGVCDALARRANGSMRDAQSLLEQLLSFASKDISLADVNAMLGTIDDTKLVQLVQAIREEKTDELFAILKKASEAGIDYGVLIEQMMGVWRDLMVLACRCGEKDLIYTSPAAFSEMKSLAESLGIERILASLQILEQACQKMRYSTQSRIIAEMALVRLACLGHLEQIHELIKAVRNGVPVTVATPVGPGTGSALSPPSVTSSTASPVVQKKKNDLTASVKVPLVSEEYTETASSSEVTDSIADTEPVLNHQIYSVKKMNSQTAESVWREMLQSLGAMILASQASAYKRVIFKSPNRFIVSFPPDLGSSKSYCENETVKLRDMLNTWVDSPVALEFQMIEGEKTPPPKPATNSSFHMGELLHEADKDPKIRLIKELFDAELVDVKIK